MLTRGPFRCFQCPIFQVHLHLNYEVCTLGRANETKVGLNSNLMIPEFSHNLRIRLAPSITDGVHRNENFVEIIPVFSTFSNFFKKKKL